MKLTTKGFKAILKNIKQTSLHIQATSYEFVMGFTYKTFEIELYTNEETIFSIEKLYLCLNGEYKNFDLSEAQLKTLQLRFKNAEDLAFEEFNKMEEYRIKEEKENISDIDYYGHTN